MYKFLLCNLHIIQIFCMYAWILGRYGYRRKFVKLIQLLHNGMIGQVLRSGDMFEEWRREYTSGIDWMVSCLNYWMKCLHTVFKKYSLLIILHFCHELMLNSLRCCYTLQHINLNYSKVLYQIVPNTKPIELKLIFDSTLLTNLNCFKYLGRIISRHGCLEKEIKSGVSKTLGSLHVRVLNQPNICISIKLKAYRAVVIRCILYVFESWTLY